jgi:hypothetical protein
LGGRISEKEEQTRMKLYKQGLSDGEIARKVGVKRTTIISWRYLRALAKKRETKKRAGYKDTAPQRTTAAVISQAKRRKDFLNKGKLKKQYP